MNKISNIRLILVIAGIIFLGSVLYLISGTVFIRIQPQAAEILDVESYNTCEVVDNSRAPDNIKRLLCSRLTDLCIWLAEPLGRCVINGGDSGNFPALKITIKQQASGDYVIEGVEFVVRQHKIKPTLANGNMIVVKTKTAKYTQTFVTSAVSITEDFQEDGTIELVDFSQIPFSTIIVEVGTGQEFLVNPSDYRITHSPCDSYDSNPDNDCPITISSLRHKCAEDINCESGEVCNQQTLFCEIKNETNEEWFLYKQS